jgi:hypothetical protein
MFSGTNNIFQTPWLLLTVSVILLGVTAVIRQTWPQKRRWWQIPVFVVLAAAAFGIDYFVKTDYEKVEQVIVNDIKAAIRQDFNGISSTISGEYSDTIHKSKEDFMVACRSILSRVLMEKAVKRRCVITVSSEEASAELIIRIHLKPESQYAAVSTLMFVEMKISFRKNPDGEWLVRNTEILSVNNQPLNWRQAG